QIGQIFEGQRMVHRAEFEVTAVFEDLLWNLARQYAQTKVEPARRLIPFKKATGKDQCFGIAQKMIAKKVVFQAPRQPAGLNGQASDRLRGEFIAGAHPLDPIHNAQRRRIRLPARTLARWVLLDPPRYQLLMPVSSLLCPFSIEVVEIVE